MTILVTLNRNTLSLMCALALTLSSVALADDTPSFATGGYAAGMRTREMMAKVDTNGDGMVSKDEWIAFHEKVFQMLDKQGKGLITAKEFVGSNSNSDQLATFATGGFARGLRTDEMMQKIDTNHDGLVSREEYMANQMKIFEFMNTSTVHKGMLGPREVLAHGEADRY